MKSLKIRFLRWWRGERPCINCGHLEKDHYDILGGLVTPPMRGCHNCDEERAVRMKILAPQWVDHACEGFEA